MLNGLTSTMAALYWLKSNCGAWLLTLRTLTVTDVVICNSIHHHLINLLNTGGYTTVVAKLLG